jgi:hypothetical protein
VPRVILELPAPLDPLVLKVLLERKVHRVARVNLGLRVTWVIPALKDLREILGLLVHKVLPVLLVLLVLLVPLAQPEPPVLLVRKDQKVRRVKLGRLSSTLLVKRVLPVDSLVFQMIQARVLQVGLDSTYLELTTTCQLGRNPKTRAPQKGALFVFYNLIDYI